MGSYIEENLARDEQIIIKAQVTWLSQFWYLLFGILFILSSFGSKSLVGVCSRWCIDSYCSNSCFNNRTSINE